MEDKIGLLSLRIVNALFLKIGNEYPQNVEQILGERVYSGNQSCDSECLVINFFFPYTELQN